MKMILFFILCFLISIEHSIAQEKGSPQSLNYVKLMSLEECISTALENNYDIKLIDPKINAANAALTGAFGSYLPNVNYNLNYTRQLTVPKVIDLNGNIIPIQSTTANLNNYSMGLSASLMIFDGFGREANYEYATKSLSATNSEAVQTKQDVKITIIRQYIDVIRNAQIAKIQRENLISGQQQLKQIQAQYEAGIIPKSNLYAKEADLGNSELELINAENNINIAKTYLLNTMGMQPDTQIDFTETSLPVQISEIEMDRFKKSMGSVFSLINKSLENRQDYTAAKINLEAQKTRINYANSGYYPQVSLFGGWNWTNSKIQDFDLYGRSSIGLNLALPIFDNFRTNNNVQTARLSVNQSEIFMEKLEQQVKQSVQIAYLNLEAAEKQVEITKRTVKSAELNYESINEQYKTGTASITEMLISNTQFINAKINLINAIYNYIRTQKEILHSIGDL